MKDVSLIIYTAADLTAGKRFFRELIGGDPYVDSPQYVGYKNGDMEIGLVPKPSKGAPGTLAYWTVERHCGEHSSARSRRRHRRARAHRRRLRIARRQRQRPKRFHHRLTPVSKQSVILSVANGVSVVEGPRLSIAFHPGSLRTLVAVLRLRRCAPTLRMTDAACSLRHRTCGDANCHPERSERSERSRRTAVKHSFSTG